MNENEKSILETNVAPETAGLKSQALAGLFCAAVALDTDVGGVSFEE